MKKIVFSICIILSSVSIFAQSVEIEKSFPFSTPWNYYETWDANEGVGPALSLIFPHKESIIVAASSPYAFYFFDNQYYFKKVVKSFVGSGVQTIIGKDYFILGSFIDGQKIIIYDLPTFEKKVYVINVNTQLSNTNALTDLVPPYLTGNMLFAETSRGDLVSWELLGNGENKYRNIEETTAWLADGNAEKVGYRRDNSIPITYFGDFTMSFDAPLNYINWQDYVFPEGEFENIDFLNGYIGTDEKGLSYFKMKYPLNRKHLLTMDPFQFCIAILDTWTKKVYFRVYPAGTWDPPRTPNPNPGSTKPELIARLAWAVHPNGDVYFFDADVDKQEYQLKKLTNDWWAEIGIEERRIGRIEQNYIPLQQEASVTADNNGYNYEREFVWILEESPKTETVDGKTVPWVKVRKLDGREGWILLSDVYF